MKLYILVIVVLSALNCRKSEAQIPYQLHNPGKKFELTAILNEISGITDIDNEHLALVQDELGLIFIFDLNSGKVVNQFPFDSIGDFEGLTYTGKSLFVLRSDGRLTEWKDFDMKTGKGEITHHMLPVQTKDNEGLCYDKQNQRLLIAAKSKPGNPEEKQERFIYSFNLITHEMATEPVFSINTEELSRDAGKFGVSTLLFNEKGKPKTFNFRPSSLAVHPKSGEIYILSAADYLLIVLDKNGTVVGMHSLQPDLYPKAEGITFLSDGTMLISNEAAGKVATVLKFEMNVNVK